ncbi:MAG TPA: alkaline phosphatase PafA [Chryseolinea sp.]|nr:alkaline phosphatase PafA [Chryseolinea sp.]
MLSRIFSLFAILLLGSSVLAQKAPDRPKLVVGIIVDQMRQEYLYRFYDKFGDGGFKRLMGDGFMLKNAHYNYAPTVTGPGHASVYTGTTPAIHGIIGNDYFDKQQKKYVNCVADSLQKPVGSDVGKGDISPWRMLSSTVTDELELFTQKRSKVIGISSKDRGAVLPAGHMADAAYWYDGKNGNFISSTFYMTQLPEWLVQFNSQDLPQKYLTQDWTTLLPVEKYTESGPDETPYERQYAPSIKSSFPYKFSLLKGKLSPEFLGNTPFADDLLTELAKAVIVNEKMGKDEVTDFLCISFSAPDAVGHRVGPNAVEVEDVYLRLDKNIEDLLKNLDQQVGAGNYTLFLTADHAVADVPQYLKDNKVPAGYFNEAKLLEGLEQFLAKYYPGKRFIQNISNDQIFLNHDAFVPDPKTSGIDLLIVTELIGRYLMTQEGVANYYTGSMLREGNYTEGGIKGAIIRGYNARRSGDIVFSLEPGWFDAASPQGTTHGSPYNYDTHVPALFYGFGIKKGSSVRYHPITDIAPTISALLRIKFPSGCTGQPVAEIFE